jgi:hypothetical protein
MRASRGMGDIRASKMPKAKTKPRRDNTNFTEFKKGGLAKQAATAIAMKKAGIKPKKMAAGGKVNAAGNYTKPSLRKRIVSQIKSAAVQGTGAGQWSARKAQLVAKRYKAAGGGYK